MPKVVDHAGRRQEFIEASLRIIASEGLDAVTLKRAAADAGFTTGAIAHYFHSRRDLLIAALREAHRSAAARMTKAAETAASAEERLMAVIREALPLDDTSLREWRVWVAFWGAAVGDSILSAENAERYAEWRGLLGCLCQDLVGESEGSELAVELLAAIDGLGLQMALASFAEPGALAPLREQAGRVVAALLSRSMAPGRR